MANISSDVWVALYLRLSDEDRDKQNETDDSRSIQNQRSMLTAYAETNGWCIYKVYSDDDYTGADRNRPQFNELLKDAEARKFSIVLCKSQSRFTREMELVEHYLHDMFPRWGIRFVGLVDNADTANKGNKKARQINGLVNEWYLEDLSDNIKGVLKDLHMQGRFTGSFAPYGYMKDPNYKGHLLPDPEAADIVHRIFEMYANGMGKTAIARKLNAEGIPNPTEYKRLKGIRWKRYNNSERSALWQYFVIADILRNEVYIGHMVQGKSESMSYKTQQKRMVPKNEWIRVENTHAPIIERELWNKVQMILDEKTKPGWNGEVGPFARKMRCMYCGYTMRSEKQVDGRRYFRCNTHNIHKQYCKGSFIGRRELDEVVLGELHKMIAQYLDMDDAERQIQVQDEHDKKMSGLKKQLVQLQNKLENATKALKVLYQDRVNGIITVDEYITLSGQFKEEVTRYENAVAAKKVEIETLEAHEVEALTKKELLLRVANVTELNYDIVNTLIDYIEVGKREGHYRKARVPLVIHWKF